MIMTHEQFIELSTAKLAKQAGFDWESRFDNQQQRDEWQQVALVEVSNPDYNDAMSDPYSDEFIPFMSPTMFVMLPHITQSVLQRWLREVKNIWVSVTCDCAGDLRNAMYRAQLYDEKTGYYYTSYWDDDEKEEYAENYPTYEAALEAGLRAAVLLESGKEVDFTKEIINKE